MQEQASLTLSSWHTPQKKFIAIEACPVKLASDLMQRKWMPLVCQRVCTLTSVLWQCNHCTPDVTGGNITMCSFLEVLDSTCWSLGSKAKQRTVKASGNALKRQYIATG